MLDGRFAWHTFTTRAQDVHTRVCVCVYVDLSISLISFFDYAFRKMCMCVCGLFYKKKHFPKHPLKENGNSQACVCGCYAFLSHWTNDMNITVLLLHCFLFTFHLIIRLCCYIYKQWTIKVCVWFICFCVFFQPVKLLKLLSCPA